MPSTASRSLVFDHLALFTMIQNTKFIEQVKPPFDPAKLERVKRIAEASIEGRGCPSCGLLVDSIRPLMSDLGAWLEENRGTTDNPGTPVQAFVDSVTTAFMFRPEPIIIHWRKPDGVFETTRL